MKVAKDPEIKLFGKKIALLEIRRVLPAVVSVGGCDGNGERSCGSDRDQAEKAKEEEKDEVEQETNKDCLAGEVCETGPQEKDPSSIAEESKNPNGLSESDDNSEATPTINEVSTTPEPSKNEKYQSDATNSQQKTLKKPDKILPCPRCNSMDTKFCYYNNYNVNQPRHFCKSCQRYWTAGGTMRNVPVGAGRRKNKNSSLNCHHISISEALEAAQIDAPNGYHHPAFKRNGTVLSFGPEAPLCESMASVLDLAEKKAPNGFRNGYYKHEQGIPIPCKGGENGDDCSSGSSVTTSSSIADGGKNGPQKPVMQNVNGFPSPIACLPGVAWPFPWNPAVPVPAICPSGFSMPFYPVPYWNCNVPGLWSMPWLSPTSSAASPKKSGSGPNSPTLGKHSRDGELLTPSTPDGKQSPEQKKAEGSVLVPKTLRIDDPDEAAKSSIWATLGIKYDSVNKRGIFNGFQPKCEQKKQVTTTSLALQANPAALSRSLSFQEIA